MSPDRTDRYRAAKRTIAPSGSCASLVAARIAIATGEDTPVLGAQGTELLLAAIYADTAGMTMRVTAEDTAAVEQLIVQTPGLDIDTLFHQCRDKKDDVSHLTIAEIFRKDYKTRSFGALQIGAAAMSAPLAVLIAKGDVYKAAQE
jgi:exopolyphosphatase